jgi:HEAT repeat protein
MMRTCESCRKEVESTLSQCPNCHAWSQIGLLGHLTHADPEVRRAAASSMIFLDRTEPNIRALAIAFRDPVPAVRQAAGVTLFSCGAPAVMALPELIESLDDPDPVVRRLAAGVLSMVGPPAKAALARLAQLRNTEDELLREWVAEAERCIMG